MPPRPSSRAWPRAGPSGCRAGSVTLSSPADLEALRSFQNQMAAIQRDAVWWLHTVVPSVSKLAPRDYAHWYGPRAPARGAAAAWPAWRPVTALTTEVTGRRLAPASQEPAGPALVWRQGLGQSLLLQGRWGPV